MEDVSRFHFLDSIAMLNAAQFENKRIIDIGSGAGFPGIPLKIVVPSIILTLLDSAAKRVEFVEDLCAELHIDAAIVNARAEEAAHAADMRESYDIVLSRGVAHLSILCELCLPFVNVGGLFIAMKGIDSNNEIADAYDAITSLGAETPSLFDYAIPGTDIIHRAVIIRKIVPTPDIYPRRYARIKNSPL